MRKLDQLQATYQEIADLTLPRCMEQCHEPGGCCAPEYCDLAEARAREFGVELPLQENAALKYMGREGCVVPPYLRPLCAVHVCDYQVMRDSQFGEAYLKLREAVRRAEEHSGAEWPQGMARDYWE